MPSPPPSDGSDESDNFAFTRVGDADAGPVASSSKQAVIETASQPLPSRTKPVPQSTIATSQSQPTAKSRNASSAKTHAQLASSDLLQSLKEVRQNGTRKGPAAAGAAATIAAQPKEPVAVVDRKGKRKAEDSAGEDQDESTLQADAPSQGTRVTQSTKSTKAKLKKGRVAELSREDLDETQQPDQQPPDPGTPARPSTHIPVNTQETPAIQRNLAMRAGVGNGAPPGTPGSSRRSSGDLRGRRGSSTGNGLEGGPLSVISLSTVLHELTILYDDQPCRIHHCLQTHSTDTSKPTTRSLFGSVRL